MSGEQRERTMLYIDVDIGQIYQGSHVLSYHDEQELME